MTRTAVLLCTVAMAAVVAGCGSDSSGEEGSTQGVSIPAVTAPSPTTSSAPQTTAPTASVKTTGGGRTYNPTEPDSATNDIPPPKGSPQEQFEQQCQQQGTCD